MLTREPRSLRGSPASDTCHRVVVDARTLHSTRTTYQIPATRCRSPQVLAVRAQASPRHHHAAIVRAVPAALPKTAISLSVCSLRIPPWGPKVHASFGAQNVRHLDSPIFSRICCHSAFFAAMPCLRSVIFASRLCRAASFSARYQAGGM